MDNNLDLDGQTAPESTRGLFDFPEVNEVVIFITKILKLIIIES